MKKLACQRSLCYILLVALIFTAASCKKNNGKDDDNGANPEYYISFKANGVQKKYINQALASLGRSSQDGLYNAVLQGYPETNVNSKSHIGIIIFNNSAVAANTTYQDPQKATNSNGSVVPKVLINYLDDAGNGYLTLGPMVDKDGHINDIPGSENIVADAKVSVTKLTNTYVEGTFSGTTFLSTDATFKTKIVITEGKFILKRLQ